METSFQQRGYNDETAREVGEFLSLLETLEGTDTHLTQSEFGSISGAPSFQGHLWSLSEPRSIAQPTLIGLGVYQCEDGPELFTACLPDHREMSLFLPMMQWADALAARTHPSGDLTVWAWEHDICTPYLLLRLDFRPGKGTVHRGDAERVPYLAPVGRVTDLGPVGA